MCVFLYHQVSGSKLTFFLSCCNQAFVFLLMILSLFLNVLEGFLVGHILNSWIRLTAMSVNCKKHLLSQLKNLCYPATLNYFVSYIYFSVMQLFQHAILSWNNIYTSSFNFQLSWGPIHLNVLVVWTSKKKKSRKKNSGKLQLNIK